MRGVERARVHPELAELAGAFNPEEAAEIRRGVVQ